VVVAEVELGQRQAVKPLEAAAAQVKPERVDQSP
jgi:hypothetical protein